LRPAVDVLIAVDSRSQLNSVRLTHNTRHAATAPN